MTSSFFFELCVRRRSSSPTSDTVAEQWNEGGLSIRSSAPARRRAAGEGGSNVSPRCGYHIPVRGLPRALDLASYGPCLGLDLPACLAWEGGERADSAK